MVTIATIAAAVEAIAPPHLAEDWDNTGLLLGDPDSPVERVMTCLTITPESAAEAIDTQAGLIVSHHPLPFRSFKQITTTTRDGELMWRLARAGVAVYSPHTAFDSAAEGVNAQLAARLGLMNAAPLAPTVDSPLVGSGRVADAAAETTAEELARQIGKVFGADPVRLVAAPDQPVKRIGFACGSGGSLLDTAISAGCDALVTGEATFHTCLAAELAGVALLLMGHYHSERFALEWLAERLAEALPKVTFWASRSEKDPLRVV